MSEPETGPRPEPRPASDTEADSASAAARSTALEPDAPHSPGKPRTGMFRSLAVRNYRLFAGGQLVSNTGTWMQRIAQDWLVLQLSGGSGVALGLTTALQFLPMLLFGLWGGTLVDRLAKRRLLLATQSTMGLLAVGLGVLATSGAAEVWHVY